MERLNDLTHFLGGGFRGGVLLRLGLFALLLLAPLYDAGARGPEAVATEFVEHVQRGALEKAKRLLEDSRYRSQHPDGDGVYFVYESGYDPSLAFMVGRPFVVGTPSARQQRSDWYVMDGTAYADVALPLRFETYRPWVLPGPIAFGRAMEFGAFMNFVAAPAGDAELLSLRIRPSLEAGLIRSPKPRLVPPPPGPPGAQTILPQISLTDSYGGLIGSRPVDPAPVLLPSGKDLTPAQLSRFLPRLTGGTLHLSLVRRGRFASWKVSRWKFSHAVLITDKGEVIVGAEVGPMGGRR